jgi:hypothetical protein
VVKVKKKLKPCQYCGMADTVKGNQIKLVPGVCICGDIHGTCVRCVKELSVALGEFPEYKVVLKRCPPKKELAFIKLRMEPPTK